MKKGIPKNTLAAGICFSALAAMSAFGDSTPESDVSEEIATLQARIDQLESKLASTKSVAQTSDSSGKKPIMSSLDAELYGFVFGEASYDTKGVNSNTSTSYAGAADSTTKTGGQLNATAGRTRLGVKLNGPEVMDGKTSGCIEGDFWGGDIRLRLAYMKWERDGWHVLAGQSYDLLYSFIPGTLNFSMMHDSGVVGVMRQPQFTLGKTIEFNDDRSLTAEVSAYKQQYSNSKQPHAQARLTFKTPLFNDEIATFRIGGMYGNEKVKEEVDATRYSMYGINGGASIPFTDWLEVTASGFTGKNIGYYYGGLGQTTVNTAENKEVHTYGGWGQVVLKPFEKFAWTTGAGTNVADKDDIKGMDLGTNVDVRKSNLTVFTNITYSYDENLWAGIELAHMKTKYRDSDNRKDDKNNRVQLAVCYKF